MKSTFSAAALAATAFLAGNSVPFANAAEIDVTAELAVNSRYFFRGLQEGGLTALPSVEASFGDAYAGLLSALPLADRDGPKEFEDRYDAYLGYGWAAGSKTAFDAGGAFRYRADKEDNLEAYLGVRRELGTLAPSVYIYRDFETEAWSAELAADIAAPIEGVPFAFTAFLGRVEASQAPDYTYYGLDARYPVKLSDALDLSLGLHYTGNDRGGGYARNHLYGSAAVTFGF